jgi:hypothetical protein
MVKRLLRLLPLSAMIFLTACGGSSSTTATTATAPTSHWVPRLSDTWQWQLHGTINTNYAVNVYDIDLFEAPQSTIGALKAQGKRVVCYFSAGGSENWRPDFNQFLASDMGNNILGWPGERWLDTRSANVRAIMKSRLDMAVTKGCDGVEPDLVDGYANNSGFPLTGATQLDYNGFLSTEAHARGLAIALKNDISQIGSLVSMFDFAVNEQCFELNECSSYTAFINLGKPVFNAEYAQQYVSNTAGARDALCVSAKSANIHTLVLPVQLDDSFRFSCD